MNIDLDLDISNYQLSDILALFNIPMDFNESELKKAKTIVLKMHPDKSRLDPDYFRFYSKAYKMLYSVWEFRKKGDIENTKTKTNKNTDYNPTDKDNEKNILLDQFFKSNKQLKDDSKSFNKWFNDEFDKNKLSSESDEKGYESWFRGNEDDNSNQQYDSSDGKPNITMATMGEEFEKRKVKARTLSLIVHKDIQEIWSNNSISSSELSREAPSCFDSGLFSNLGFQDLQKAYTETVIPITQEDFEKKDKFKNVDEYVRFRGSQNIKPLTEQQSMELLNSREKNENETATKIAYDLAKQSELAQHKNKQFWSSIQHISNNL